MYRGNYSLLNVNPGLQFPPLVITIAKPEMTYRFPFLCLENASSTIPGPKPVQKIAIKFELESKLPIKLFFLLNCIASPVLECHIPFYTYVPTWESYSEVALHRERQEFGRIKLWLLVGLAANWRGSELPEETFLIFAMIIINACH